MHLEFLTNIIINGLTNFSLNDLLVILSNLDYLQDIVVPLNGYDIDLDNISLFFEMLFQCQNLSVEEINGVYVNCITVNDLTYTVHPDFISFLIHLFIILEFLFY